MIISTDLTAKNDKGCFNEQKVSLTTATTIITL